MEPAAPPAARRLRPGRVSAKRSWPPGCGRFPATAAGPEENSVDGGASTAVSLSPVRQNGAPPRQQGSDKVQVAVPGIAVQSCSSAVDATSMQNGGLPEKGRGGSSDVDVAVTEIGIKTAGGSELLQRKENGIAARRRKRWMESSLNPPPKKRAVSAVRTFPPGCGRTAQVKNQVLDVSPAISSAFAPGCGRSLVNTGDDEEGLPSEAAPVNNGGALAATMVSGDPASPTLALETSDQNLESRRIVDRGHSKLAHNRDDFTSANQRRVVPKATLRNVSDGKMKGKLSPHNGKQVAQAVMDDKMKNKLDGNSQTSHLRTPLSNPIDAKKKVKWLDTDKMDTGASAGGKKESKNLSAKEEVACSNMNTKQKKFVRNKLKGDDIGKDNLHLSARESKLGKHVASGQIEEPKQIIVQALLAPVNCPWTRGRKSIASASKSLGPRNKLKGKDAKDASASKPLVPRNAIKGKDAAPKDIPTRKVDL